MRVLTQCLLRTPAHTTLANLLTAHFLLFLFGGDRTNAIGSITDRPLYTPTSQVNSGLRASTTVVPLPNRLMPTSYLQIVLL